jgi:SanA protein
MKRRIVFFTVAAFVAIIVVVLAVNLWVNVNSKEFLYSSIDKIPQNKVGLLLGTSKFVVGGNENLFYKYRIDATVELYKAGKISYVLISGDNRTKYYDEPSTMQKDLIARGIPKERIFLDYAGFRTLDSIVRAKEVFGQASFTVISQPFHNQRAVCIAKAKGINAIGFNAKAVGSRYGMKTHLREKLARVKMVLDLLVGKQPHFLGEKIEIK